MFEFTFEQQIEEYLRGGLGNKSANTIYDLIKKGRKRYGKKTLADVLKVMEGFRHECKIRAISGPHGRPLKPTQGVRWLSDGERRIFMCEKCKKKEGLL